MERKRHIGNDIVNIVFIDQSSLDNVDTVLPTMFDPTWIKSQFTRTYILMLYLHNLQSFFVVVN